MFVCAHDKNVGQLECQWQDEPFSVNAMPIDRVTWGMTAPGGKKVPPPVDNLKLPRTFTEYTEC